MAHHVCGSGTMAWSGLLVTCANPHRGIKPPFLKAGSHFPPCGQRRRGRNGGRKCTTTCTHSSISTHTNLTFYSEKGLLILKKCRDLQRLFSGKMCTTRTGIFQRRHQLEGKPPHPRGTHWSAPLAIVPLRKAQMGMSKGAGQRQIRTKCAK